MKSQNSLYSNTSRINWSAFTMIAHAAGGISDKVYTNSLEAFTSNYEKGFRLFEIDFLLTKDNTVVARHDWKKKHGQNTGTNTFPLDYTTFIKLSYYDSYTPMDFSMVLELMRDYPDCYIIIDGKVNSPHDTQMLYNEISKELVGDNKALISRLIPQVFYQEDVAIIQKYGFKDLIYVVGREDYTYDSISNFCFTFGIQAVSLSRKRTNIDFIRVLKQHHIFIYLYTFNDRNETNTFSEMGIDGFFTDFLPPKNNNSLHLD